MTDRGTVKLPRDVYEHHNERRKQAGLSWSAYIEEESVDVHVDIETESIASEVAARIDYAQLSNAVADEVEERLR